MPDLTPEREVASREAIARRPARKSRGLKAVGLLGFVHQGLTHLTGITTLLGTDLADGQWRAAWEICAVILAFLAGCVLSGFIIQDNNVSLRRRYGVALAIESVLLFVAAALGVFGTGSAWPDLIVASIMATLAITAAVQVLRQADGELKGGHGHAH